MDVLPISDLAHKFITAFLENEPATHDRKITVNPVVLKFATWYEKLRNAMEYRDEEVILRAAVERILRRRLLLGGNAQTTAEPLVRELIWAGYLSNGTVSQGIVIHVEKTIDLYLQLRLQILKKHKIVDSEINEWTYQLMSSELEYIINPKREKEMMSNFMFQILQDDVTILDDNQETKNAQVFLAVRKAFAKDDIAFLRYHLFQQYFGKLTTESLDQIIEEFLKGYEEIRKQLLYPRKEKIFAYIKNRSAAFLILEDILRAQGKNIKELLQNKEEFEKIVLAACEERYKSIASKVQRAVLRSVLFILLTKVVFAFGIEGTYERFLYGKVIWTSILLNTGMPPILMLLVGFAIRMPGQANSKRILSYITSILQDEKPRLGEPLVMKKVPDKANPVLSFVFTFLWGLAFIVSFGIVIFVLTSLHFNIVSQFIFIIFLAIVSFLSYRISLTAHLYTVAKKQGLLTPIVDFFFMPIIRVGRRLTEGIAQVNFILFLFDIVIETPFKGVFAFFEQWFFFLHAKREELE